MKLIDKYLYRTYLVPLFYCLTGFILFFVIFDLFNDLQDFVEAKTPLNLVVKYYLSRIPINLVFIAPISLLLAALYSLNTLAKNNELTAMRASGVSLYRLMVPLMICGFIASVSVAVINETAGPKAAYWTHQFLRSQKHKDKINVYSISDLAYMNHAQQRIWYVKTFNTKTFDMNEITIIERRPDGSEAAKIKAKKAQWLDGEWWFTDVTRQEYRPDGRPKGGPQALLQGKRQTVAMTELTEIPQDFLNLMKDARENPEQFSSKEWLGYINRHEQFSEKTIAMARTDFHSRIAMPWACLIVTLLGIPFGAQTARKGAMVGILLTLVLFFAFYVSLMLSQALGKGQYLTPWLAAWLPNFIFAGIGGVLIYRMR